MREILQMYILGALAETDFFEHAIFCGGTAHRLIYGASRYSADLDFDLRMQGRTFSMAPYAPVIAEALNKLGIARVRITTRPGSSTVTGAQVSTNKLSFLLMHDAPPEVVALHDRDESLNVKMDFETSPPEFGIDVLVDYPKGSGSSIRVYNLPTLHAGKAVALVERVNEQRNKGRDMLDYLFHVRARTPFNASFFKSSINRKTGEKHDEYTNGQVIGMLEEAFGNIDYKKTYNDAKYYAIHEEALEYWNKEFFLSTLQDFAKCPFIYPENDARQGQSPQDMTPGNEGHQGEDEDDGPTPGF